MFALLRDEMRRAGGWRCVLCRVAMSLNPWYSLILNIKPESEAFFRACGTLRALDAGAFPGVLGVGLKHSVLDNLAQP